jgi:hypothetical protein
MVMPRQTKFRLGLALFAAFQILLPMAADLADARMLADGQGLGNGVHIESERSTDCPRGHPDDCALCHVATHLAHRSFGARLGPAGPDRRSHTFADGELQLTAYTDRLPLSRAPPVS